MIADVGSGWRIGVATGSSSGRARWYASARRVSLATVSESSLGVSAGRCWDGGWYASLGTGWVSVEGTGRAAGLDLSVSGLPRGWALDIGRMAADRAIGVRLDLARASGVASGRVAGIRARSPWRTSGTRLTAYTYRRSARGTGGFMAWHGRLAGPSFDLLDLAGFDHGALSLTGSATAVLAFAHRQRGRTMVFFEAAAGWLHASVRGDAEIAPGIPGLGAYAAVGQADAPWAHVALAGSRALDRHWFLGIGLRLDATWPRGDLRLTDSTSGAERAPHAERLTGGISYAVAPTLGVTYRVGSLEAACGIAWPVPVWKSTAAPPAPARRPVRLPAMHVVTLTYSF